MATKRILIVGPSWVGDAIMMQSLLMVIKQQQPESIIDVLAPASTQPILERMPEVNQSLLLPFQHGQLALTQRLALGQQLRQNNYQQALVLPNSLKSALIPFWANIPQRTGWLGELRWGLLNDVRYLQKEKLPLMIQRFASLALPKGAPLPQQLPWPKLAVSSDSQIQALQKYGIHLSGKPILALCPGAEYGPAKRWPAAHYARVAAVKLAAGWEVWLFGGPNDQPAAASIQLATQTGCVDLIGKTTLPDAIDLLSLAHAVVCNDSGLMHVTAALNRPLVALYGSSNPSFTPPLSQQAKILSLNLSCSPCMQRACPLEHFNCLNDLSPDLVLTALDECALLCKS